MTPSLGGFPVFGYAVHITMVPNANAAQTAAFFGVQGVQEMDGGTRGRTFQVEGLMAGANPAAVQANESALEQFADGNTRILYDTTGAAWPNVVYKNNFMWQGKYAWSPTLAAWVRPYRLVLHGLT